MHFVTGFREMTGLLFDQQQLSGRADNGEIDFTDDREVVSLDTRPVHAVIDGVGIVEPCRQLTQRLQFTRSGAGGSQFFPAVGEDFGHWLQVSNSGTLQCTRCGPENRSPCTLLRNPNRTADLM